VKEWGWGISRGEKKHLCVRKGDYWERKEEVPLPPTRKKLGQMGRGETHFNGGEKKALSEVRIMCFRGSITPGKGGRIELT